MTNGSFQLRPILQKLSAEKCKQIIADNFNIAQNCNTNVHVLATAGARLGYTWLDRLLIFSKLGGAWTTGALAVSCNGDSLFFQGGCFPANNPANPAADVSQDAGNVKALSPGERVWVRVINL